MVVKRASFGHIFTEMCSFNYLYLSIIKLRENLSKKTLVFIGFLSKESFDQ